MCTPRETGASANQLHIPALSTAPLIATEPSRGAGTAARLPLKEPIGVRAALTINTSWKHKSSYGYVQTNGRFLLPKLTLSDVRVE